MKKLLGVLLVLVFALVLVGCAPKDAAAAKKKMEKKDYDVVVVHKDDGTVSRTLLAAVGDGVVASVTCTKKVDDKNITVTALLFESAKAAKAWYGDTKEKNAGVAGKWVYYGDEQAVKDFK